MFWKNNRQRALVAKLEVDCARRKNYTLELRSLPPVQPLTMWLEQDLHVMSLRHNEAHWLLFMTLLEHQKSLKSNA